MERVGFGPAARGGVAVACEMEAAEALAGLSWCPASGDGAAAEVKGRREMGSQDKLMAAGQFDCHASSRATSREENEMIANNISRVHQPNPVGRPKLTEAERQAKQLRRVLANREAARKTIKRRQANFVELTRKAADMSEENENLKKEKDRAMEEYNSLKHRNEFLKAQLEKTKKFEPVPQDPKICWPNQKPSMVPCFWPPIFPPAHFSPDAGPPKFPLFLYPVPCLLPFFAPPYPNYPTEEGKENSNKCSKCSFSKSLPNENNNNSHLSTNLKTREMEAASNSKRSTTSADNVRGPGPGPNSPPDTSGDDDNTVQNHGPTGNDVNQESTVEIEVHKEAENICGATAEARRKRKVLMRMRKRALSLSG